MFNPLGTVVKMFVVMYDLTDMPPNALVRAADFLTTRELGAVDVVCGGVPCQPFSGAGKLQGKDDERNLFEHAVRCVRECAPRAFVFAIGAGLLRARFA